MILYTIDCPKCKVLEMKLKGVNKEYDVCKDVNFMKEIGLTSAPVLELDDGRRLTFSEAISWIKEQ